jgi:hypothetical protein
MVAFTAKPISIYSGVNFSTTYSLTKDDGSLLNLTGYAICAELRKFDSSTDYASFNVEYVDILNGKFNLTLSPNISSQLKSGRYYYDILILQPNGKVIKIIQGNAVVYKSISAFSTFTARIYPNQFGAVITDNHNNPGDWTITNIDSINDYGVVAFGHFDDSCTNLPSLTSNFQDSVYKNKILNYLDGGGIIWYIGEYQGCGDTAAHNTRLELLGTSIRLGSLVLNITSSPRVIDNVLFPETFINSATNEVIGGIPLYQNGPNVVFAYEKIRNGIIVVSGDSNGTSKNPTSQLYVGLRSLVDGII